MVFNKILVANRGEIAVRIAKTARAMGYGTVAVYSEADAHSLHVQSADQSVCIGPPPASQSYLNAEAIIAAAKATGAGAVHPGYGFLAENAGFARACQAAGLVFIGPPPSAIELMGSKRAAKAKMLEAGVPCIDGYHGEDQSAARFVSEAGRIGYPIMVKASAGGGGRGMRLVTRADDLPAALVGARDEAENAFGDGTLLLEQGVVQPRHVEIQIFADGHGNAVHLGERDCSIQRRHQKVIEESPSPAVGDDLRQRMGGAAVTAAKACGYVGAGTVEFLLDPEGRFFFLEMNTRLQVEHPVTELVTGLDLVEWQLRIAGGEALPLTQHDVRLSGHAIEARLYAEDPARGFLPQTGRVLRWQVPDSAAVRVDTGIAEGSLISPHYDPMIAKVIAYGATREDARRQLSAALRGATFFGLAANKTFLANVVDHPVFARGEATTAFLSDHFAGDASCHVAQPTAESLAVAGVVRVLQGARALGLADEYAGWRCAGPVWTTLELAAGGVTRTVDVAAVRHAVPLRFTVNDSDAEPDETGVIPQVVVDVLAHGPESLEITLGGAPGQGPTVRQSVRTLVDGSTIWIDDGVSTVCLEDRTHSPAESAEVGDGGTLRAPLDGAVWRVMVAAGDAVKKGDVVLVLEAMKMEHRVVAPIDGQVAAIHVAEGDQVKMRALLAELQGADDAPGGES